MPEKPNREVLEQRIRNLEKEIEQYREKKAIYERLGLAVKQSINGIAMADRQGVIIYANPAWAHMHGYKSAEELVGINLSEFHNEEQMAEVKVFIEETMKYGSYQGELGHVKKDGTPFITWHSGTFFSDEVDNPIGLIGICNDISQRKQAEESKTRIERQYQQAQKMESIGRLAGGVAHDLSNLLSPVLAYSEMLLAELSPDNVLWDYTDQILRAGLGARDLVHQLLSFGRGQASRYQPVDLNQTVSSYEKLLRRTIRENIEIEINTSHHDCCIIADPGQIEQVIMNLTINAADAMPDGGRLIIEVSLENLDENYVSIHQGVEPGQYAMLVFSDTGSGMDGKIQEHLFEPFFSTKGEQGSGLGLAIVYGIVKQHGGHIWVYSEPGSGSTFKVYLPVYDEVFTDASFQKKPVATVANLDGEETILLVEDDEQVRHLAHTILRIRGYDVLVAKDGRQALDVINEGSAIDLLLSDVIMPGLNGPELFKRAAEKLPGLKVLFMSGYTNGLIVYHDILGEDVEFLPKPFTSQGLLKKVREVLEG